jgi:hypothetical protein
MNKNKEIKKDVNKEIKYSEQDIKKCELVFWANNHHFEYTREYYRKDDGNIFVVEDDYNEYCPGGRSYKDLSSEEFASQIVIHCISGDYDISAEIVDPFLSYYTNLLVKEVEDELKKELIREGWIPGKKEENHSVLTLPF